MVGIPGGRKRRELAQGRDLSRGKGQRGGNSDDGRVVELLLPMRKWHIDNLYLKTVKRRIAPQPYDKLGVADIRGWSSATTPWCPFSTAQNSGVWPS